MLNQFLISNGDKMYGCITSEECQTIKNILDQSVSLLVINNEGKITYVNDHFCELSTYQIDELLMEDHTILNSGYPAEEGFTKIHKLIKTREKWIGELCIRGKLGEKKWINATIIPYFDEHSNAYHVLCIFIDITTKKDHQRWKHLAFHDELTGLPNRRMLNHHLDSYLLHAKQKQTKFGLLFMDINDFKFINDSYGHMIGDELLIGIGARLSSLFHGEKCVFRQSGDEFIILLDDVEDLEAKIDSIILLFNQPFVIDDQHIYVSISIGVSLYPEHSIHQETLINYADISMFYSKQSSGNTYQVYRSTMQGCIPPK